MFFFFFQAEDGIRDYKVTGVQTCALPISLQGLEGFSAQARNMHRQLVGSLAIGLIGNAPMEYNALMGRAIQRFRQRDERSEEHTSELQSPCNLVCRLLLEKKKKKKNVYLNTLNPYD